jgi:hypothetical protein
VHVAFSTVIHWSGDLDWVGVFTIALAAATVWLARATRALARETKQELEHSQRPVVAPTALVGHDPNNKIEGNPPDGHSRVTVKNVGVGPALNISINMEPLEGADERAAKARVSALGAGVERRVVVRRQPTDDFCLELRYEDVAGKRYLTEARWSPTEEHWIEVKPHASST